MDYTVRELRIGDAQDAELLAAMWNASEEGWPGGWTHGVPETGERILERKQKSDRLAIFVVEAAGEIVGYCDVMHEHGRDGVAYIPLLNVRPACHGKGCGKALLLRVLEFVVARGYRQLTLGTWAGNLKAVPLYKKTGFFWVPETDVFMQNYIPTALSMPAGRPFFARHDWYAAFRRELAVAPDEVEWNGVKVFPYLFQAQEDLFGFRIDKQAEAPTAVETNDWAVACIVGKEEVVCGVEQTVRWEVERRQGAREPLKVTLLAEGEPGIGLSVMESLEVAERAVVEKRFTVAPEIKRKEPGLPAHQIHSTLLINGVPVRLGTAVKPVQPVEIQYGGQSFVPGKPDEEVVVRLKSNLGAPARGELVIAPHPALHFDRLRAPFTVPAKSWTSCKLRLQCAETGAVPAEMRAVCSIEGGPALTTKAKPVVFRAEPLDQVYAWEDEENETVTIESPALSVQICRRGGDTLLHMRGTGREACRQRAPELGPPFVGWREVSPLLPCRVEQKEGKVTAALSIAVEGLPGVIIEKRVTVGAGSVVRVEHRVVNGGDVPLKRKLRLAAWCGLHGKLTAPLRDGLLHEPVEGWGGFPLGTRDLPRKPEEYAESWFALEEAGLVCGIVRGDCEEVDGLSLDLDLPELPPQSFCDVEPLFLVAGRGNWEVVRQLWRRLRQPAGVHEERPPVARPVLIAGLEPDPLLIVGPETPAVLSVRNRRGKAIEGRLAVTAEGLEVAPTAAELQGVKRDAPFAQDGVIVARDLAPRVVPVRLTIEEEERTREMPLRAVVLGDGRQPVGVREAEPGLLAVENGRLRVDVAPGFLGSATALEYAGASHLKSAYPQARPHDFMNPWFGGIHPYLGWIGDQRFAREQFRGEPTACTGRRGIAWQGVKVWCDLQHKDLCWLRVEMEYLTVGRSNVLAIVQRLVNRTDAPQWPWAGFCVWPAVGGSVAGNRVLWEQERPRFEQAGSTDEQERVLCHRNRTAHGMEIPAGRWAAVESRQAGHVLALVGTHPQARIEVFDEGRDDIALNAGASGELRPGESREFLWWLVLCDSVEQARGYRVLGEVGELP